MMSTGGGGGVPTIFSTNTANLNGVDQYFDGGNICNFGNIDFSYFGWFYANTGIVDRSTIMGRYNTSTQNQTWLRYRTSSNRIEFLVQGGITLSIVSIALPSFDAWHFIYAQYDSSAQEITISINNGSLATPVSHTAGINSDTVDFNIGEVATAATHYWDGYLGFIGALPSLMTTQEITDVYNSGTSLCYDSLPSGVKTKFSTTGDYWELANWTGHTSQELTGQANSNTLTNINTTPFTGSGLNVEC